MVRIYCEPFYDGHLERYEDGVKNSYGQGELFPDGVFMVMEIKIHQEVRMTQKVFGDCFVNQIH